ncbi:hypothetical protein DVH26_22770 [Paenibacillus sp. H1-7]|uniref:hypothetical protein n=1 Tax=Paenibacillus sp. H1-7 TaxID=2282849 RepID=UPI001EF78165|nr:hypothetical protein [Paenibacillus sp. H1-7]ULL17014.1 hypothetical protein DVH26_22770 [Paenibacillus sp. H1-7]
MHEVERFHVLIVGSTFAGLGLASSLKEKALVVERTGSVGAEFIAAFRNAKVNLSQEVSPITNTLMSEAVHRSVIGGEGGIHWPAFAPLLYRVISSEKLPVRFLTRVIETAALPDGGYEVTLMGAAGLSKVQVDTIIDTTSFCETAPDSAGRQLQGKRLNAMIHRPESTQNPPSITEGFTIYQGRFASEWVVSCPLELDDDWHAARERLLSFWEARPESLKPWKLATIADAFDVSLPAKTSVLSPGWLWHPSAAYADPIAAFEAGVQFQMEVPAI